MILKKVSKNLPVYGGWLVMMITDNMENALNKYTPGASVEEPEKSVMIVARKYKKSGAQQIYVYMNQRYLEPRYKWDIIDTIGHEMRHIVNEVFEYRGVSLDLEDDEHAAYFQGVIMTLMMKFVEPYIYGK